MQQLYSKFPNCLYDIRLPLFCLIARLILKWKKDLRVSLLQTEIRENIFLPTATSATHLSDAQSQHFSHVNGEAVATVNLPQLEHSTQKIQTTAEECKLKAWITQGQTLICFGVILCVMAPFFTYWPTRRAFLVFYLALVVVILSLLTGGKPHLLIRKKTKQQVPTLSSRLSPATECVILSTPWRLQLEFPSNSPGPVLTRD